MKEDFLLKVQNLRVDWLSMLTLEHQMEDIQALELVSQDLEFMDQMEESLILESWSKVEDQVKLKQK